MKNVYSNLFRKLHYNIDFLETLNLLTLSNLYCTFESSTSARPTFIAISLMFLGIDLTSY